MDSGSWIAIYLPLFIVFFVVLSEQQKIRKAILLKVKERRSELVMTNDAIRKFIGLNCRISTGSFGSTVDVKIVDVNENWIEVETKKGKELINADFVQNIKAK